jgi:DnaJ-class molecular chaperone
LFPVSSHHKSEKRIRHASGPPKIARFASMKTKTCPDCNGDGVVDKDTVDERQCPTCGGLGFVRDDDDDEEVIKTSRHSTSERSAFCRKVGLWLRGTEFPL